MTTITRNQIYQWFLHENRNSDLPETFLQMIFKSISDEMIAQDYGFQILRKGLFY